MATTVQQAAAPVPSGTQPPALGELEDPECSISTGAAASGSAGKASSKRTPTSVRESTARLVND